MLVHYYTTVINLQWKKENIFDCQLTLCVTVIQRFRTNWWLVIIHQISDVLVTFHHTSLKQQWKSTRNLSEHACNHSKLIPWHTWWGPSSRCMRYQSRTCSEGSNRVTKGPLKSTSDKNLNTSTFTFTLQNCPWQLFPLSTNSLLPVLQLLFLPPKASLLSKFQLAVTSTNGLSFLVSFAFGISSFLRHFTSSHQSLQYWSL